MYLRYVYSTAMWACSMGNECEQQLCMRLNMRKTFTILIEKGIVNNYLILCVFGIVTVFKYDFRILQGFRIFVRKRVINYYWMKIEFGIEYIYRMGN